MASSDDNSPLSGRGRGSAPSRPSQRGRAPSRSSRRGRAPSSRGRRGRGGRAPSAPSRGGRSSLGPGQGRGDLESTNSNPFLCKNMSCGSVLRMDTVFCKSCCCHLCGIFDEPRDDGLWITCRPDNPQDDSCESSCHIECAIKAGHLGASRPTFTPFHGSYWCAICGKLSDILGCWKKLLNEAKDSECLGDLCYRLSLSDKLIGNVSRYSTLNSSVKGAITDLERDVGPLDQLSDRMKKSSITQRPAACYAQKLCRIALQVADMNSWRPDPRGQGDSVPPACRLLITDVYMSVIVMRLNDCATTLMDGVIRFEIWCWRYQVESIPEAPTVSIESHKRRVEISGLQPSTEYAIKIVSSKTTGPFGVTLGKCSTKNASIIHRSPRGSVKESLPPRRTSRCIRPRYAETSQVPVIPVYPSPTGLPEGLPVIAEQVSGPPETAAEIQSLSRSFGTRLRSAGTTSQVPVITDQVSGLSETAAEIQSLSRSRGIRLGSAGTTSQAPIITEQVSGLSERAAEIQSLSRSHGIRLTSAGTTSQAPVITEQVSGPSERAADIQSFDHPPSNPFTHLMDLNADPVPDLDDPFAPPTTPSAQQEGEDDASRVVQENTTTTTTGVCPPASEGHVAIGPKEFTYGECVNAIIRLEREGFISQEFRMKFLTWFSLEAKEDMKKVLHSFLSNLSDDLKGLADQLVDTFASIIFK